MAILLVDCFLGIRISFIRDIFSILKHQKTLFEDIYSKIKPIRNLRIFLNYYFHTNSDSDCGKAEYEWLLTIKPE